MRLMVAGALCAALLLPQPGTAARAATRHRVNCEIDRCVALTFDDGPSRHTARLLDTLRRYGVQATFFVVGRNTGRHRALLRRMIREGHEIGTHTQDHADLTRLSTARVKRELRGPIPDIESAGVRVRLARPPYGATDARIRRAMRNLGLRQVLWNVDPQDWRYRNAGLVARHIIRETGRGEIVLSHDIHPTTVDAMPRVIRALQRRGYRLVTVSDLRGWAAPRPAR